MDGTAVKEIARLEAEARTTTIHLEGRIVSTRPLYNVPLPERRKEDPVDVLEVQSLQAVVDYLTQQEDGLDPEDHFVHVEGPDRVRVIGPLLDAGETNQRHTFLRARVGTTLPPWGTYLPSEEMVVAAQALFRPTDDRVRLLRILGNLVAEETLKVDDDGVTQIATAKSGVQLRETVDVKNPFDLAPYRTFREVEAPESPFVLRLKKEGASFRAGLWEADGGAWEVEAVARIKEWFSEQQTGFMIIG